MTELPRQSSGQRPARPGETCKCGRPAVIVYLTEQHGEVPYCGIPDGGADRRSAAQIMQDEVDSIDAAEDEADRSR